MTKAKLIGPLSFYKESAKLAIPVLSQAFIQALVSLIDNFMVAGLGDIKMSGVNITNQLFLLFLVTASTLAIGSGIFMSQYNGTKDEKGMKRVFRFKFTSLFILAISVFALLKLIPHQLLSFLVKGNSEEVLILDQAISYTSIVAYTCIPMAISYSISSALREIGMVKPPLVFSIIAALVNTVLNFILIYGYFGMPRLEVSGAALATVIARVVEAILFGIYYYVKKPIFFVKLKTIFSVNKDLCKRILKKSIFIIIADVSWVGTETIMMALYNSRGGSDVVSGMAAGWTIANLFFVIFPAVCVPIGIILGYHLGRDEFEEAKNKARYLEVGGVILGIFVAFIMILTSRFIVPLVYVHLSLNSQSYATNLLYVIAIYIPIWTLLNAQFGVARSGGDTLMGVYVDTFVNFIILLPIMYLLTYYTLIGPVIMFALVKLTDILKFLIASWRLKKGYWIKNLSSN